MNRIIITTLIALACTAPAAAVESKPAVVGDHPRLARFDKDGNGRISREEFIAAVEKHEAWIKANKPELYKRLDVDGDGNLTAKDRQALHERWVQARPELKDRLDRNDDGKVGPAERRTADRVEDRADRREDVRDRAEDRADRREDVRDAKHDGGLIDDLEDTLDRREDGRDAREDVRDRREGVRDRAPGPVGGPGRR